MPPPQRVPPGPPRDDAVRPLRDGDDRRDDRREIELLRELVTVYSHLSGLASRDATVEGALRLVASRTGAGAVLLTPTLDVLAAVPDEVPQRLWGRVGVARLSRVLVTSARTRLPVTVPGLVGLTVAAAPVVVGDEVAAHLLTVLDPTLVTGRPRADIDAGTVLLLAEHAATICGVILGRERVVAAAAGRARRDLIDGLLLPRDREDADAERWAGHLGLVPGAAHRVLAVAQAPSTVPGPDRRAAALDVVERTLLRHRPDALVSGREREVVAVVPERSARGGTEAEAQDRAPDRAAPDPRESGIRESGIRELGEDCLAAALRRHPEALLVAGAGDSAGAAADIARSYREARGAVEASLRTGRTGVVVAFADLGIARLLLQVPDLDELRGFATGVLGELATGRSELRDTLIAWFACNGSPQRTGKVLHVHPNTVGYRIRRVGEVTGLDLDDAADRLTAQVACEIVTMLGERW